MRGLNTASVDLIYLDPPFNTKKQWRAPIGTAAEGAEFQDSWTLKDVDLETHERLAVTNPALHDVIQAGGSARGDTTMWYLLMMSERLLEMQRVLKPTGSIYLHCDPTESHSLKLMMDTIFGTDNFRNEIVWSYNKWTNTSRYFQRSNDIILFYTKTDNYIFNKQYVMTDHKKAVLDRGYDSNVVKGVRQLLVYNWDIIPNKVKKDPKYDRIVDMSDKPKGIAAAQVWTDIQYLASAAKERVGYPTQKPVALVERIIKASSKEGDLVLDPFCGCATAAIAAEKEGRQWIGIDISHKAIELVQDRLHDELGLPSILANHRTDIPQRTDLGNLSP